jgi:hypothetical protein
MPGEIGANRVLVSILVSTQVLWQTPPMPRAPSIEERLAADIAAVRASGHSLAEIARACRISRQTLWRIEVGDCRRLSFDVGSKIEDGIRRMRGEG